jgi:hypothetical protein
MNFTYQNHLRYSIAGREFGSRTNSIEKFKVMIGMIDHDHYKKSNYQQELLRTADLVFRDYGKDFALFLSGGTDSEIVARNFLDIGIKPTCYTIKFKNDYNASDVNEAIDLAKELDIPLNIINFDVKDFMCSGEASEFGKELQCTQITYLMVYYCIKKIGLPAVMGGEAMLRRNISTDPSTWYYCFRENEDASAMRFSNIYKIPLVNEWFSYTPELLLYYLEDPEIYNLVTTKNNYKLSSVSSKNSILKKMLPYIRVREKTHGFEKLLGFNYESYRKLSGEQIYRLEPSLDGIEYNSIINMLRGIYANS